MSGIKITRKKDSLELATKILDKFFLESGNKSENSIEFEKWKKWFLQKREQYKSGQVTDNMYFIQISKIQTFLVSNTSINTEELFQVEKIDRISNYDSTPLRKTIPQPLSDQEISKLTSALFNYLTADDFQDLKSNPRVESLTRQMRNKRFGFSLKPDPLENIRFIEENDIYSDNINRKNYLLGELFLESGQLEEAEKSYLKISNDNSQKAGLLDISIHRKDFDSFKSFLSQAYPESFKPETYGRYVLSFLIGNERRFKYEIDTSGKRYVSFAFSTGLMKIAHIDLFATFLFDIRAAPDERMGLWLSPTETNNNFINEISTQLDYKQVLGWKDL